VSLNWKECSAAHACSDQTKRVRQMGCGWRSRETAASNYPELPMPLASNADWVDGPVLRQTSGTRGARSGVASQQIKRCQYPHELFLWREHDGWQALRFSQYYFDVVVRVTGIRGMQFQPARLHYLLKLLCKPFF